MKKITLSLFTLVACVMMLISCGGGDIKGTATAFINAANKYDFESAKKYAAAGTKAELDKMTEQLKTIPADQKKLFDEEVAKRSKYTFTIKDVKENGEKATVTFTSSEEPSKVDSLHMVKESGKWLVDMKGL
jgi:Domain of unknown function (DUF4878)